MLIAMHLAIIQVHRLDTSTWRAVLTDARKIVHMHASKHAGS